MVSVFFDGQSVSEELLRRGPWASFIGIRGSRSQIMGQTVPSKIAISSENFPAHSTMIWLDICMSEKMSFEIRPLVETPTADWTFVRGFFHVKNFMHCQGPRLAKPFSTLSAFERFLLAMNIPETRKQNVVFGN